MLHLNLVIFPLRLDRYDPPSSHTKVDDTSEEESNQGRRHDDDVVRHAEIWRGQIHKKFRSVEPKPPWRRAANPLIAIATEKQIGLVNEEDHCRG